MSALQEFQPRSAKLLRLIKCTSKNELEGMLSADISNEMSACDFTPIILQNIREQIQNEDYPQACKSMWLTTTLSYIDKHKLLHLLPRQLNLIAGLYIRNKQPLIADGLLNEAYEKCTGSIYIRSNIIESQCLILSKMPKQEAAYLSK
jgi:hypothetical protein